MNDLENILFMKTVSIANMVANNDYSGLKKIGCLDQLSEEDIRRIIAEYGGKMSVINMSEYEGRFDYYSSEENHFETELDLIIDEKVSDLTLMCELTMNNNVLDAVISDIHVL